MSVRFFRLCLAAALVVSAGAAGAAEPAHDDHDHHHHHGEGAPTLQLNDGSKWKTDDVVKASMEALQKTLAAKIPAIHEGKLTNEQYAELAGELEKHLFHIMNGCKLEPATDAQFHILLADIFAGLEIMKKGEGDRIQGAIHVVRSLSTYGEYFDHPGWKPLKHGD